MSNKYLAEDCEILGLLHAGCAFYHQLCANSNIEPRVIDRRLQALRKSGRVKFKGQSFGWRVIK